MLTAWITNAGFAERHGETAVTPEDTGSLSFYLVVVLFLVFPEMLPAQKINNEQ